MNLIPEDMQEDVLVYAFRYALGRMTYAVSDMQKLIMESWPNLSPLTKEVIKKDIVQYREFHGQIGMDMDHQGWLKILEM